jgi:hypothetical protein
MVGFSYFLQLRFYFDFNILPNPICSTFTPHKAGVGLNIKYLIS